MANSVKVVLNSAGIQEALKSAKSLCASQAAALASSKGSGYTYDVIIGKKRAVAVVKKG